ncbi:MAG: endonuclease [Thermoleophilia bacterium]|nr:MAG: endonuclease [Thermoleophilia bacterium]
MAEPYRPSPPTPSGRRRAGAYADVVIAGAHISSAGGLHNVPARAAAIGADGVQVFIQSARTWKPTAHKPEDLAAVRAARERGQVQYIACHAIYFINLATDEPDLLQKSRAALLNTIDVANAIAADGIVLHVGSHKGRGLDVTLPQIVRELQSALQHLDGPWLLLENSAGAGGTIGRDPVELARIINAVDHPRLGLCIDTCHAYVSGVDVTDPAQLDALVIELDTRVGIERLRCLHVNDAAAACGSNRDRHANVVQGEMGKGLAVTLSHPALTDLPMLLETPGAEGNGPDAAELTALRALHKQGLTRRAVKARRAP